MRKPDNKGFTLVETMLCFVIMGIIMVIASQIIHSTTEVYYYNKSVSYGMQASGIAATEITGEIEDAMPLYLYDTVNKEYSDKFIKIGNTGENKYIEFINSNGMQIKYTIGNSNGSLVLKKYSLKAYDEKSMKRYIGTGESGASGSYSAEPTVTYDSKYLGMGYEICDISISKFQKHEIPDDMKIAKNNKLEISDYPVLTLMIKARNKQYEEYEHTEYIPLYNFYGIINSETGDETGITFESIIKII
ncbi:MAG: prepilin-type N-terminal cleavage/methylation domain-containing protein [Lachnospiraceae bacterium]|nr:prepilin-type N-terminal cleavage/methylation domain-containing protein [Lachnospiraceae bacterium]